MFIPSIYKSTPQIVVVSGGTATITAVVVANTRLTILGIRSTDMSGGIQGSCFGSVTLTNTTTITRNGSGVITVLVEEFIRGFLRQDIIYGSLDITAGNTVANSSSLGTFSSKAYPVWLGIHTDVPSSTDGGDTSMAKATTNLTFNSATGVLTATRGEVSADVFQLRTYYCIVDPR
jgi:hypothetical protein